MPTEFVNWETPHVHPLDLTPDGTRAAGRQHARTTGCVVFDLDAERAPALVASIPVGLDPVSVRARTNDEAWVVNHISDSVSIVDLAHAQRGARRSRTDDEPADVVFAGNPQRAFVSCSQANTRAGVRPGRPDGRAQRIALSARTRAPWR